MRQAGEEIEENLEESNAGDPRGNLLRELHFYQPVLCGLWGEGRRQGDLEFSSPPMEGVSREEGTNVKPRRNLLCTSDSFGQFP